MDRGLVKMRIGRTTVWRRKRMIKNPTIGGGKKQTEMNCKGDITKQRAGTSAINTSVPAPQPPPTVENGPREVEREGGARF